MASNRLTTLPEGIFDNLNALGGLHLAGNQLSTLPAGVFSGLSSLTSLYLDGNAVNPLPLTVSLEKVGADQVKAVAPSGAPFDMVLPLTVTNGSISGGATTLTIPAGSLESQPLTVTRTPGTTAAVTVDIGTLPGLPTNHSGYALVKSDDLPLEIFSLLAGGICDRTSQVQTAILAGLQAQNPSPSTCAEVTAAQVATGITSLFLNGQSLTALQADDFEGLTSLQELRLYDNQLTTLPDGLFDGLTALTTLYLNGNQLSTLPDGLFDGLSALTTLYLYGNSVDPLPLTVSLQKVGADQVKAVAPAGAPFEIVLPLTVANGGLSSGATTITIPAGSLESQPLTVTRTPSTTAAVTMDIGTLPRPPTNHSGYELVKSADLPLEVISATTPNTAAVNIPDANLRANIETALGKTSGDPISAAEMATLTSLAAQDASISDLTGLETATNLTELQLWDNEISNISAVAGLTNLTKLYLWGNAITDISHVAALTNLTDLRLGENSIANVSAVAALTNLTHLYLRENSVSDIAAVVGLTNLTELRIGDNTISSIAAVANLTNLVWLDAPNNSISDLAAVANLTSLTSLTMSGNSISDLSAVAGLTDLLELFLAENAVSDLSPLVSNTGLGENTEIDVQGNPLSYPSIYTHIPALQARSIFIEFDNRTPTTLAKVSGDSQQGTSGTALAQPFVVEVQDANSGAFVGVPVAFAITAGGGTLSATSTATDANGRAASTLTLGNSAGTNTVQVSVQGISQTETFTAEATTTDTDIADDEPLSETTYASGEEVPTLPTGFWTPDETRQAAFSFSGGKVTIEFNNAGEIVKDGITYTCASTEGCTIEDTRVTKGIVRVIGAGSEEPPTTTNNAPVFTDGANITRTIAENTSAGVNISTAIAATDADNDVLTYTLGGTDAAAFAIDSATGQLKTNAALDYETKSSYSVVVTVSDDSLTDTINVTINVTDLDESLIPVCDRTPQVRDAIVAAVPSVSTCGEVTKAHLTSDITSLFLDGQGITTLQAGDFEDLTSLTELRLYDNQLTTLPAGIFDGLTGLTRLYLNDNQLSTLPEGLFDGLSSLTTLYLYGNAVDPLPLTVSLEKVGTDQVKAVAPTGAPFEIVLPLTVTNGSISGGATTITIPAGSLESESLTVVHTSGTTAAVTVDIGTLPELPTNHNGYALVKSSDLPLVFNVSDIGEVEESIVQEPDSPEQPEEVGEPRTVRLFYFLPNDRTYRAEVVEAMKTGILEVQSFYAEQMETHGYGNKTFQIETDDQGDLIVHRVDGDYPESYYISRHYFTQGEINRAYDNSANVILIVMDASRSSTILGHSYPPSKESGKVTLYEEWDWSTAAHELGHAFDLRHDFRSNAYIMSYGWADRESGQLSVCAADFLAVNPYFDSDIPLENESPPTVELISSATYPFGSVSVSVQLRVRDDDGLHQVILLSQPRDPSHPPTPAVRECRGLAGETDTVVEFNFAWRFDAAVNQHSIYVVAVDTNGNSKQVPFILESEPPPQLPPGTAITPVCDRTPQVRDAILDNISGISDCAQVTETHLVAILGLNLQNRNITALKAGDFDGLISLTTLWLQGNQLSSLPAGLFDHLDALTTLWLQGNQLSSLPTGLFDHLDALTTLWLQGNQLTGLPEGLFDGLTALEELFLNGNQLSTLPEGLFDGLTTLTQLRLYGNSVDPLLLTVSLEKVGTDQVKAIAPTGAPFEIVLPLTVTNGSISGATSITIPAGSLESLPITVTRTPSTTAAVTMDMGTLPGLPANHSGYALGKSTDLPLEIISATTPNTAAVNIPDANLRANIETALGKTSGDPISPAEMATLTSLAAQDASISDLTGLETATNLTELQLWDNEISDIAAVAELTNLTKLYLWGNAIADLSHVAGLTNLTDLRLGENSIANASHVAGLTNLTHLDLRENSVSDMAAVAGLTNLTELRIGDNTISSIAAVASLTKLEWLDAPNNSISDIAVVANLTNLTSLDLSGNSIADLSAVAGLTKLLELYLAENAVSDLSPLVANTGLGADNEIDVQGNLLDYPSIYTHIPALQARSVFIDFDNRTPTTLAKVSGDSQQGTSGTALPDPFVIEVQDGESAAFAGVPVTFAVTAGGTLSATSTATDANGQAESTLTLGNSAGTNTVRASAQGIAQSETFTAEATTTDTAVGEGTEVTTYNVGDTILLPTGFQTARLTIGSGRAVTADNGTYTCVAAVDCIIANGAVSQGTIEVTTSAVASNNAPEFTDGVSTTLSVAENTVAGVNLGAAIAATDADNEVLTYTLGGTDAAAFAIDSTTGQVQTSAALDYETTSSYSVVVTVSDGSLTDTINVTINVTDLDESLIPVCDRTPQVRDAIVAVVPGVSTCGEVTKAHLTSDITSLFLNGQGITTLQAGDFEDLTSLTELRLYDNQLTTLPAGLFDGLGALTMLYLNGNQLTTLPDGLFDGLSSLATLYLYGNSVDPLSLTVSLEKVGADQVKAVAPSGAPFDLVLPLTVANGDISGGATTITIPAGGVESQLLTVVRTPGTTAAVTVDIGTLPGLPANHSGYALVKSTDLPLEVIGEVAVTLTIPDANLRAKIETALGKTSGDPISAAEMATLTALSAQDAAISDLTGLETATNLTELQLWDNNIADMAVVAGLTNLTKLYLWGNAITDISHVAGLTNLTDLRLGENSIANVSAVAGLTQLTHLGLRENSVSDISAVATLANLTELRIGDNTISSIAAVANLTKLEWLDAPNNSISDIAAVTNLTSLTSLDLSGNSIADLSAVTGLTNLLELILAENAVSDLSPLVANTGLGADTEIDVQGNPLDYPSIYTHIPALQARSVYIDFDNRTPTTLVKISGDSQQGTPSTALAQPFVVEVQDGESAAFAGVPVTFAITAGGGTLSATSTATDANGQAASTLTLGNSAGTNTVQVSVQGIAQSETFTAEATTTNTAVDESTAVTLELSPTEVAEDAGATTITVTGTLNGAALTTATDVRLTISGTATRDADYSVTVLPLTIPAGSVSGTATLTLSLVDDSVDEDDETVIFTATTTSGLTLSPSSLTVTITDNDTVVSAETTVCDRTPQVRDAIVGILQLQTPSPSTCGEVTEAQVSSGVTSLFLNDQGITALQAGDFAGLTSLTELRLYGNQLSTLPDGLFDGLSALTTLYLNGNQLSALPDGLFNGLSALTTLYLYGNSVDPLPLTVSLEKVGADQVKAVAPSGAPFEMVLPLSVANGSISGGATTITIPAGSFESQPLTVTRTPGTAAAVTVDMGTLPGLPANHSGYALGKSADLPLEMFSLLTGGICDRTAQVQTAIVAAVPSVSTCDEVTQAQLAVITSLNVTDKSISSLKVGDFDGLSALTTLNLTRNQLSSLPAGIFDKLNALKELHLGRNQLSSLPAGIFDKLNALTTLNLSANQLSSLPAGIFDNLNALTRLYLAANQLSSLPAGIFDKLNTLTGLDLGINSVNPLPLTVSLEKVGEGQFKATVPAGAPFDIVLPLTVADGTITGGANSVTIRAGRVESDVVTVTRTPGTTSIVTVNIGILPGLPANHLGYALVKSADLPLEVISSPANTAPAFTDGTSTTRTVAENTANGVLIGTAIAATDADNDVLTYTLGGTDAVSFDIERATGQLKTSAALDYETKSSYSVAITVSDGNLTDTINVTINVTDIAEQPAAVDRTAFESSTPAGYTQVTLSKTGTVWGVPTQYASGSDVGTLAFIVLGTLKGCSFANAEADRPSKVYIKTQDLGQLNSFGSATACGTTTSNASSSFDGARITHLRFFDESSTSNVKEAVYNAATGQIEIPGESIVQQPEQSEEPVNVTLSISTASPLTEETLDESVVTLTLSGGAYESSRSRIRDAVTVSGIDGVTVRRIDVDRVSDTVVTVELTFDGTDFDTDATLTVIVGAGAIEDYDGSPFTAQIVVTATIESEQPDGGQPPEQPDAATDRMAFESSTPAGYTQVTLSKTGTVWGVPTQFTDDSAVGTLAFMVLGTLKGCSFANAEAARPSKVYIKTQDLGSQSNYVSETMCGTTTSSYSSSWAGSRITHLRFFDESSTPNIKEAVYNAATGQIEIPGESIVQQPEQPEEPEQSEALGLTARFEGMPASHDGSEFQFELHFSEEINISFATVRNDVFDVTGGTVTGARRLQAGSNLGWKITIEPDSTNAEVLIILSPTDDCEADGAVCTEDGQPLSNSLVAIVPGAEQSDEPSEGPTITASTASPLTEATLHESVVTLTLSSGAYESSRSTIRGAVTVAGIAGVTVRRLDVDRVSDTVVTVELTFDGTNFDTDATLTFIIGADAIAEYDGSPLTAQIAVAASTESEATEDDGDQQPDSSEQSLTARFEDMPAVHDGSEFTFELHFSEEIKISRALAVSDTVLEVTGGTATRARRLQPPSNLGWRITIEPDTTNAAVSIVLPPTTDCDAVGAVCTEDGRPLANELTASVPGSGLLTARFAALPAAHDGSEFTFEIHFSEEIEISFVNMRDDVLDVTGGVVKGARRLQAGSNLGWNITIEPDSDAEVLIVLPPTDDCEAAGAVCTEDGRPLSNELTAIVPGLLTARFEAMPAAHDGSEFTFELHFSEKIEISFKTLRDTTLDVTGGVAKKAQRLQAGSNLGWKITIEPESNAEVLIVLPPPTDCEAAGAICTEDGRPLSNELTAIVPGPAAKPVVAPRTFGLDANYPNPFNAQTQLVYTLPVASPVELAIYNVMGQRVRTLVQGMQAAGRYQIAWDGRSDSGSSLASGVYLSRLVSTQGVQVRRLLLLK